MPKPFARKLYASKEWAKVRAFVYERDHGLCVDCGAGGQEVHHIKYLTEENINNPEVTLNAENLILLCKDCHHKAHGRNQFKNPAIDFTKFD